MRASHAVGQSGIAATAIATIAVGIHTGRPAGPGHGVVLLAPVQQFHKVLAMLAPARPGQHHGGPSLAILDVDAVWMRHQQQLDGLGGRTVAKGQVEGQHPLIVGRGGPQRVGAEEGRDDVRGGAEDDRRVEGEEAPPELALGAAGGVWRGGVVGRRGLLVPADPGGAFR